MAAPTQPSARPGIEQASSFVETEPESIDLRAVGDRIETLLQASSAQGAVARERTEELLRLVSELYGRGLERMMDLLYDNGVLTAEVLGAMADDDLVASLLLVHGLHPEDVTTRVERALDSVRPYLDTHGGNVELLGITDAGIVQLRLLGSCDGCSSSAATMSLAVEDAVSQAAPEITGFDVQAPSASPSAAAPAGRGLLPLAVVTHHSTTEVGGNSPAPSDEFGAWHWVQGASELTAGEVVGLDVGGMSIIICRNGTDLLAFRDECAVCGAGLKTAHLERRLGAAVGGGVLTCPQCHVHYDVRRAPTAIDMAESHLSPLPLLTRSGRLEVAIPQAAPASALPADLPSTAVIGSPAGFP